MAEDKAALDAFHLRVVEAEKKQEGEAVCLTKNLTNEELNTWARVHYTMIATGIGCTKKKPPTG
jgi:hypothetical protein